MEQIYSIIEPRIKIRMSQYHQKNTYAFGYIYRRISIFLFLVYLKITFHLSHNGIHYIMKIQYHLVYRQ